MTTSHTRKVLTDRGLKGARPTVATDYPDAGQRGLLARVFPDGRVEFSIRYRYAGKRRRLKLGELSDEFTLAKARKAARHAIVKVDAGGDPAGDVQAARRAAKPTGDTVADLAVEYLEKHAKVHKDSWKDDDRMLRAEILPRWKARRVADLSRRDVRVLVEAIAERGSPVTANRCLSLIRKMLNFAIQRDWLEANVASLIPKPAAERSRERVLTDDEIRQIWRCLTNLPTTADLPAPGRKRAKGKRTDPLCPISPRQAALLQIRLLTAQRGGEVARMRWQDVDLATGWWTIPAEDAKNDRAHRVPLVGRALEIITKLHDEADDEQVYVFSSSEAGAADRAKKAPGRIAKVLGITDFRGHDLRRTAATKMAEAGISSSDIAKVLNHSDSGPRITQIYNRYDGDREKRIALETWDRVLTAILEQKKVSTIVPFVREAAQ